MPLELISKLVEKNDTKLCLLVLDGLGGLPSGEDCVTELEAATTPNLDELASMSEVGLLVPVMHGVTPGSGPGHLGLFGYDPLKYEIPRGALEAAGAGFHQQENDIAIRANFCTVDETGKVLDRRAGRIATEKSAPLCEKLEKNARVEGVEVFVRPVKDHRALVVLRGDGLSNKVCDTDPQETGVKPLEPQVTGDDPGSRRTAEVAKSFLAQAKEILAEERSANMLLLRGFSERPKLPQMGEVYKLKCAAVAQYPMYRGIAKLLGMDLLEADSAKGARATSAGTGESFKDEFRTVAEARDEYDYFFVHIKPTDSAGEDGDFERKVAKIEEVDGALPTLLEVGLDVLAVTGDHSTPAAYKAHSWHPVPALLHSEYCRQDKVTEFAERACRGGSLGMIESRYLMSLMLANARRLAKYGA